MITKTVSIVVTGNDRATWKEALDEACLEIQGGATSGQADSGENDGGSYRFTVR